MTTLFYVPDVTQLGYFPPLNELHLTHSAARATSAPAEDAHRAVNALHRALHLSVTAHGLQAKVFSSVGRGNAKPRIPRTVLLFVRMRSLSRAWASILTEVFFITTATVSATMAVVGHCPRSLDCARERRHFCQPGSSHCGPCLDPFIENKRGKCVVRRRNHPAKVSHLPELDEEIDILSSIISKHRESEMKHSAPSPAAPVKVTEDHFWPSSFPRTESSATPERPQTSVLTTSSPTTSLNTHTSIISAVHSAPFIVPYPSEDHSFIVFLGVFLMVGSVAMVLTGVCWVRMQRGNRLAQKADYPAFGLIGSRSYDSSMPGDKTLAQSAQMYHFHLQKQQMMSLKQRNECKIPESGATSDEETEDGDFTVYECPGLAPTGEMEVKNPLFDDTTFHLNLQRSYN